MAACRTRPTACDTHFPALCPARALLARVPLGPRPSLHLLRRRSPGLVRWLPRYYGGVRLLGFVHHRLRLLVFPMRAPGIPPLAKPEVSRVPRKELPHMTGAWATHGQGGARAIAPVRVAFRAFEHVGTQVAQVFAAQWLAYVLPYRRFATDASPTPSRVPTHGSGPVRIATPSPWGTFTSYSLPVFPAHFPVGTVIADRPPDRSGRAQLRHPAPTEGI